ncbi:MULTISPECIES: isoprenylcysteine carboxylmethyltransferase family protein [unclassified Rhizobium]|jgi:protein-S-isoprenylcysteine O-methyltransferase Ste14|uniref:methyltransferase family protein n=1 Tax=unclassified Rhizobium TaxID=2613769 RepID=UPI000645FDD4|nr:MULTISPECIES: isoprenylcysteine carboxylmethyltransferase family protein [unclassified Rhizobium]MBN8950832.1 isoprenylcysteine carboxylmethyltransferase family protein [Rhizobium tropici]OJY66358.1 MAG: isoprenylcysteine carboxyl methyltransferase [Rhizobium sp. 60-20]RKD69065.1 phospholipid methyltransferase [Rhizobium sp. WW_1]
MLLYQFIPACWIVWLLIWLFASFSVKRSVRQEDPLSRLGNTVPIWIGAFLLAVNRIWLGPLQYRIIPQDPATYAIGAALTFIGLLFAVWARYHIGRNWSGVITLKEDHTLIRSGPYALVRHPIYSGLMLAIIGSAIARGDIAAVFAVAAMLYAVLRRVSIEERWMSETFGPAYADYKASTPALIPFLV